MKNIVLARIDDRLIHGQVVISWLPYVKANEILVIDDETANDDFLKMIVVASSPENIKTEVLTIVESIVYLKDTSYDERIALICKSPLVFERLLKEGVELSNVNLGGIGASDNRKRIYKTISLSEEEIDSIKRIEELGVKVEFQVLPVDKIVRIYDLADDS